MDPREKLSTSNSYSYSRVSEQNIQQRTGGRPRGTLPFLPRMRCIQFQASRRFIGLSSWRCATAEETRVLPAHAALSDTSMTARS